MKECLDKGVVRWIAVMVRRLISRKRVKLQWAVRFHELSDCVGYGMIFLIWVVRSDPLEILEALDEGVIPAIVWARKYVLEDARRGPEQRGARGSASVLFERFLELIRHRPLFWRIMLRAARAVRKVQKMKLPQNEYLDAYGNVQRVWSKLEVEAERRSWIYKSEERAANTYGEKIWGHEQCPLPAIKFRRGFQLCTGCHRTLYCSHFCQKTGNRNIAMNANKYAMVSLDKLDIAYVENQISYDFHHADRSHIKNLSPTADLSQYVVKVDYTKGDLEPEMEVLTRERYFQVIGDSLFPGRPTKVMIDFKSTDKTPPAVACFSWTGDTVKMWGIDRGKKAFRKGI
ncbi:hypothetical protein V5O48_013938 [Marasmius crinis-equi]|uniref:MYND-type domain-containing protein n=1 Tax=Marasmius crinis-equi TaxID=585013 RepID=A0ABR3EYQ8_9AGAR